MSEAAGNELPHGPWEAEYPFAPHWLDVGGVRLHYVDEGPTEPIAGDPPRTMLLLHGNPTWSFYYRRLIRHFSKHFRVIAPDHMGCGRSDKPQKYEYTLERHVDNVERLVEAACEHLGVAGLTLGVHDWGGAIGMGLAVRRPQLVRRFVVFNTAAFHGPMPASIALCRIPGFGALAIRGFNAFVRGALARCARTPLSAAARTGYLAPYHDWASRVANLRFVQDIPTSKSHPTWKTLHEIEAGLAQFRDRPTLICWGAQDFVFHDTFLEGWKQRFPNAEVHRFADAGHFVVEDAFDRIVPLMERFLEANCPAPAQAASGGGS